MPDVPPKRASSMGDAARVAVGAVHRRTPPPGVPVAIEHDVTPPPVRVPPSPDELAAAVHQLALSQYEARHDHEALKALEARMRDRERDSAEVGALLHGFIMPGLKDTLGRVDGLLQKQAEVFAQQKQFFESQWPEVLRTIGELGRGLGRAERDIDRLGGDVEELGEKHTALAQRMTAAENRVQALETHNAVEQRALVLTRGQKAALGGGAAILSFLSGLISQFLT